MFELKSASLQGWFFLSLFGEMQLLLPVALCAIWALARKEPAKSLAVAWLLSLALATLLTTASKVAFIGWGVGIPEIDFTGISGHTMFAMAVYPLLLRMLASNRSPLQQKLSVAAGFALALLVGQSRLEIDVHSVSEVVAGVLVGGAVSASMLLFNQRPRATENFFMVMLFCGLFGLSLLHTPQINPHAWVTKIALILSGASTPHTRDNAKKLQLSSLQL
jgi:membrane-associated phospholipid phosphatase